MTDTICCNNILITHSLCVHISCFVRVSFTTPLFKLVEPITRMFYVVQEAMSTQKRCSVAYRSYDFTLIQCFLYQWRNKFCSIGGFKTLPDYSFENMPKDYAALVLIGGNRWDSPEAELVVPLVQEALDKD